MKRAPTRRSSRYLFLRCFRATRTSRPGATCPGFLDLIHPDHIDPWKAIFKAVLAGEPVEHLEMVLITKTGTHLAVEGSVWLQEGGEDGVLVCALFRDATRRELGEKQLGRLLY